MPEPGPVPVGDLEVADRTPGGPRRRPATAGRLSTGVAAWRDRPEPRPPARGAIRAGGGRDRAGRARGGAGPNGWRSRSGRDARAAGGASRSRSWRPCSSPPWRWRRASAPRRPASTFRRAWQRRRRWRPRRRRSPPRRRRPRAAALAASAPGPRAPRPPGCAARPRPRAPVTVRLAAASRPTCASRTAPAAAFAGTLAGNAQLPRAHRAPQRRPRAKHARERQRPAPSADREPHRRQITQRAQPILAPAPGPRGSEERDARRVQPECS